MSILKNLESEIQKLKAEMDHKKTDRKEERERETEGGGKRKKKGREGRNGKEGKEEKS